MKEMFSLTTFATCEQGLGDFIVLRFSGAIGIFSVFHSTTRVKRVKVKGQAHQKQSHTHNIRIETVLNSHTSTSTHKVQEQCFPKAALVLHQIHVSHVRFKVQSSPVRPRPRWDFCPFAFSFLRFSLSFFSFGFQQPASRSTGVRCSSPRKHPRVPLRAGG